KKMHFLLLSSTLIIGVVRSQQIADLNCTETAQNVTKYGLSAVNCENKLTDEECAVLYPTAVQMNTSNPRDAKCTGNSTALNSHLIETAIQLCPKTCGYCCLTPAYACNDKAEPRIPCSSVTPTMCQNVAWRSVLAEDCPKTCGLCNGGMCLDDAPNCDLDNAFICKSESLRSFARVPYVGRTQALCFLRCEIWVRKGFCKSDYYSLEYKMQYCGRACGLC
ncbi:Metridin ShK toxin domain containing protein, partial [Trichostrongylus colubriformis]